MTEKQQNNNTDINKHVSTIPRTVSEQEFYEVWLIYLRELKNNHHYSKA